MRTKIFWAVFLSALFAQMAQAAPVSSNRAMEIGKRILERNATRALSSRFYIHYDCDFLGLESEERGLVAFYVITSDDGGFVVVSGDDNAQPVLAISERNRFETRDMPDNVKWWLNRVREYVLSQKTQPVSVGKQWAKLTDTRSSDGSVIGEITEKIEHLTPEWNQDGYFNQFCPLIDGQQTYTGCVATAVAEVLATLSGIYPNEMPSKGRGIVGGYTTGSTTTAPDPYTLDTTYDWAQLRLLTDDESIRQAAYEGNTALLENLGHLLADCGAIVMARYGVSSTSASVSSIPHEMAEHLYMSKESHIEWASHHSAIRWNKMLKDELAFHPLVYSGRTPSNVGHSFVLDGFGKYDGEDVYHVNFGWSGYCNGYYFINHLETYQGDFSNQGMGAVFGFVPDVHQHTQYPPIEIRYEDVGSCQGISTTEEIVPGKPFRAQIGAIYNAGDEPYTGIIRFVLEDKDGNMKGAPVFERSFEEEPFNAPSYFYYPSHPLTIPDFSFGDKIVGYYSINDSNTEWTRIIAATDGSIIEELPVTPAAFIKTDASYTVGDFFTLQIMNYGACFAGTIWTFTSPDGSISAVPQSDEIFQFKYKGEYRIEAAIAPYVGSDTVEHVVAKVVVR